MSICQSQSHPISNVIIFAILIAPLHGNLLIAPMSSECRHHQQMNRIFFSAYYKDLSFFNLYWYLGDVLETFVECICRRFQPQGSVGNWCNEIFMKIEIKVWGVKYTLAHVDTHRLLSSSSHRESYKFYILKDTTGLHFPWWSLLMTEAHWACEIKYNTAKVEQKCLSSSV